MREMLYRDKCILCGSNNKTVLVSRKYTDQSVFSFLNNYYNGRISKKYLADSIYQVVKCDECGFIWQSYVLNDNGMKKLYSKWITNEQSIVKKLYADIGLFKSYADQVQEISVLLGKKPIDIKVLDFGMGWGFWSLMAKAHGYDSYGYELSSDRLKYAARNGIKVIKKFNKNMTFDFINSNQVFEHVFDPVDYLKKLAKLLKSGGIIRVSVPNGDEVEKMIFDSNWKAGKNSIHPLEHINCFSSSTLKLMGIKAGLKYIKGNSNTVYFSVD